MGKPVKYLATLLAVVFLISCDEGTSHVLPRYSGAPGELLVIIPDALYESRPGDILYDHFAAYQPMLPQAEPFFNLVHMSPEKVNNITRQHRNLLFVNIKPNSEETPRVEAQRNKWASEQLVVNVYAPSIDVFDSLMAENGSALLEKYNEYERKRLKGNFTFRKNHTIADDLLAKEGLSLTVPRDCRIARQEKNFVWIERKREKPSGGSLHDVLQGVLVYHYPYTADTSFTAGHVLAVRDSVLRQYVPGPVEGSYMTTEYLVEPAYRVVEHNGAYAVEMRGLWKVAQGAPMGGPFISLTVHDEARGRIVTAEGFVFAPKFSKREYLREVEAMIYSIEWPKGEDSEES